MKTNLKGLDFTRLRRDLSRMADSNYMKKELNKLSRELRKVERQLRMPQSAKRAIGKLETRFHELLKSMSDIQKQIDSSLKTLQKDSRVQSVVRLMRGSGRATASKSAPRATRRAASKKTSTKKARTAPTKASSRASSKKKSTRSKK